MTHADQSTAYSLAGQPGQDTQHARLVAVRDILARGKFSKSHLYNLMARGQFPAPALRCGPRFTRWSGADVDAWFADPVGWMARGRA